MKVRYFAIGLFVLVSLTVQSVPLPTESVFTEVIRQVNVASSGGKKIARARTDEVFRIPDLVRTGPDY